MQSSLTRQSLGALIVLQQCGQSQAYVGHGQLCLQGSQGRLSIGVFLLSSREEHPDVLGTAQLIWTCEDNDSSGQQDLFDCNHLK